MWNNKIVIIVALLCCSRWSDGASLSDIKAPADDGAGGESLIFHPLHVSTFRVDAFRELIKNYFLSFRVVFN